MTSYRQEKESEPRTSTQMEATIKLRWKEKYEPIPFEPWAAREVKVLQQLWVDRFTQAEEWRDVPTD